jgi:vancomycin resistance protein VanJ
VKPRSRLPSDLSADLSADLPVARGADFSADLPVARGADFSAAWARRRSWLRRAIGLLPLLHGVPLLVYLLMRGAVTSAAPEGLPELQWGRLYGLVSLLNELTPWFFLPVPLWLVTAAIARTRVAFLSTLLPLALFLALYGDLFVPRPAHLAAWLGKPPEPETRLRVMTFNILASTRPTADLARIVVDANPDVLLTQETMPALATSLDTSIGAVYPYASLRTNGLWEAQGIWSRLPILSEERWDGSQRGANWQHAVVDVHGRRVHLVSLHLTTPRVTFRRTESFLVPVSVGEVSAARRQEVAWLGPRLRALAASGEPVIVAGDLNLTDQTPEFQRLLDAGYTDAYRQAGWGFGMTYPGLPRLRLGRGIAIIGFPLVGIDHILLSSGAQARTATVWPESGSSDHRPVVVDVVLRPAG